MKISRLSDIEAPMSFDCGDCDLNEFNSYPALKIARLAVSKNYKGQEIGTNIIQSIAHRSAQSSEFMACRFLTVDAYKSAKDFYLKNDFVSLMNDEESDSITIPMYMDLKELF